MPVDRVVIAPEAFSPETLAPGNNPTRKFPWKQATGKRRKQSTAPRNRPRCGEATPRQERTEQGLLLRTAAGAVCQIDSQDGCGLCALTLAILATGAQVKDVSGPQDNGYHWGGRTGATQEIYHPETYNHSKPEEAVKYSTPQSGPKTEERTSTLKFSSTRRQAGTILQEAAAFNCPATLCTIHQAQGYYGCVWKSHVRIATLVTIYQQENALVSECADMKFPRTVRDPWIRLRHQLNPSMETNYFTTKVV